MLLTCDTRKVSSGNLDLRDVTVRRVAICAWQIKYVETTDLAVRVKEGEDVVSTPLVKIVCPYKNTFYAIGEHDEIVERVNQATARYGDTDA